LKKFGEKNFQNLNWWRRA